MVSVSAASPRLLRMRISGNHQEEISLLIIDTPHSPVVLGHPWMAKHQPQVDWVKHKILEWDASCSRRCLQKAHAPVAAPQQEEAPNLVRVPEEYHDLKEVFCKAVPPACPRTDHTTVRSSWSRIFSLSRPEREAMEKYLSESLAVGIIRSSSSWERRTDPWGPALTTGELTIWPPGIVTPCP